VTLNGIIVIYNRPLMRFPSLLFPFPAIYLITTNITAQPILFRLRDRHRRHQYGGARSDDAERPPEVQRARRIARRDRVFRLARSPLNERKVANS
jgi:hypothetical protein